MDRRSFWTPEFMYLLSQRCPRSGNPDDTQMWVMSIADRKAKAIIADLPGHAKSGEGVTQMPSSGLFRSLQGPFILCLYVSRGHLLGWCNRQTAFLRTGCKLSFIQSSPNWGRNDCSSQSLVLPEQLAKLSAGQEGIVTGSPVTTCKPFSSIYRAQGTIESMPEGYLFW